MNKYLFKANLPIAEKLSKTIFLCHNFVDCISAAEELMKIAHETAEVETFGGENLVREVYLSAKFFQDGDIT